MRASANTYDDYAKRGIMANNPFGIIAINGFATLKTLPFERANYPALENLIKSNDITAIEFLSSNEQVPFEFIDIVMFKDQEGNAYIATIYDSMALEQDPQPIAIYALPSSQDGY